MKQISYVELTANTSSAREFNPIEELSLLPDNSWKTRGLEYKETLAWHLAWPDLVVSEA